MPAGPVCTVTSVAPSIWPAYCFTSSIDLASDATFVAGGGFLELALAAAARVNLAFNHPNRTIERFSRRLRFRCLQHRNPSRDRHAELPQQRLGLIFVDVHLDVLRPAGRTILAWTISTISAGQDIPAGGSRSAVTSRCPCQRWVSAPEFRNTGRTRIRSERYRMAVADQPSSRSGAIFLQASTSPRTAATDLSKASRSLPASSISTMRSTPLAPITTGTPTYMSSTPNSPLR